MTGERSRRECASYRASALDERCQPCTAGCAGTRRTRASKVCTLSVLVLQLYFTRTRSEDTELHCSGAYACNQSWDRACPSRAGRMAGRHPERRQGPSAARRREGAHRTTDTQHTYTLRMMALAFLVACRTAVAVDGPSPLIAKSISPVRTRDVDEDVSQLKFMGFNMGGVLAAGNALPWVGTMQPIAWPSGTRSPYTNALLEDARTTVSLRVAPPLYLPSMVIGCRRHADALRHGLAPNVQ